MRSYSQTTRRLLFLLCGMTLLSDPGHTEESLRGPAYWGSRWVSEPETNLLHDSSASFWHEGYAYRVYSTSSRIYTSRQNLELAIEALAPDLPLVCFYRLTKGDWNDLASAGLGDPRTAIPPGFAEQELLFTYYESPAPGCSIPQPKEILDRTFVARFVNARGGVLAISAETTDEPQSPGVLNASRAQWRKETLDLNVRSNLGGRGLGRATIAAIARAFDPRFQEKCLLDHRQLKEVDLPTLGFRRPVPPPGFLLKSSSMTANAPQANCEHEPLRFEVFWYYESPDAMAIEVGGSSPPRGTPPPEAAIIGEDFIRWRGPRGAAFFIRGYALSGNREIAIAELARVAASIDPAFRLP